MWGYPEPQPPRARVPAARCHELGWGWHCIDRGARGVAGLFLMKKKVPVIRPSAGCEWKVPGNGQREQVHSCFREAMGSGT